MTACSLCGLIKSSHLIHENELTFCCPGCRAVYSILSVQNALTLYEENPLYKQALKFGLISNSTLEKPLFERKNLEKIHLEIGEMWCPSCADLLKLVLERLKGVSKAIIDYTTDLASIEYDPLVIGKETLLKTILSLGYLPRYLEDVTDQKISF